MTVRIHDLLRIAMEQKASDIHISAGEVPAIRIDGEIHRLDLPPLTNKQRHGKTKHHLLVR